MDHKKSQFARINVTPLCDISFTLLLTLMLATTYLAVKQAPFRIILPDVETVEPRGGDVLTLDIDEKGEKIAINGKIVLWSNYISILKEEAEKDPYKLLLIRADKGTPHGIVMRVLSEIKKLNAELTMDNKEGFNKIAFGTRKKK